MSIQKMESPVILLHQGLPPVQFLSVKLFRPVCVLVQTGFYVLSVSFRYGSSGAPPKIPGDSVLIFEVELVKIDRKEEL